MRPALQAQKAKEQGYRFAGALGRDFLAWLKYESPKTGDVDYVYVKVTQRHQEWTHYNQMQSPYGVTHWFTRLRKKAAAINGARAARRKKTRRAS
jgi:hypothetical protein